VSLDIFYATIGSGRVCRNLKSLHCRCPNWEIFETNINTIVLEKVREL
jgi:hypothetical protein